MEILVIGDWISDNYIFGTCERVCPEAPVPVIVPINEKTKITEGGAGLVLEQLYKFIPGACGYRGTNSRKERIFVDNHLVCRLDYDATRNDDRAIEYGNEVIDILKKSKPKVLIISDYGKHTFIESSAKQIMRVAKKLKIPVFVDAKHNWLWYETAYAKFPNQRETGNVGKAEYIIYKRGAEGCIVTHKNTSINVPLEKVHKVKDTTGAGDIFLAAFVAWWIKNTHNMFYCAEFANRIAAESVEHLGTFVVDKPDYF